MPAPSYVLTPTARKHLREAKLWSLARWGQELTEKYFHDIDKAALHIAEHCFRPARREKATSDSGLALFPIREHYIVYEPLAPRKIAIVAFIRQGRDIPAIFSRHASLFRRELDKIRSKH